MAINGEVIKGFTIELGLDSLGVEQGMKDLDRQMSRVNSQFNRSLSNFSRGDKSLGRLETTVHGLSSKMEVQEVIVGKNRKEYESITNEYNNNRSALEKADKTLKDANSNYSKAEKQLSELSNTNKAANEEWYEAAFAQLEATEALEKANKEYSDLSEEVYKNKVAMDKSEIALNKAEGEYNNLQHALNKTSENYKNMLIEQETANSNWTKAGSAVTGFSNKLETVSGYATKTGDYLTKRLTMPVVGLTTAAAGVVSAFGWGRLTGLDSAQAQLKGLGYEAEDVERITVQVTNAIEGGMTTMAEGTSVAAGAMAAGVEEGKELERYIKLVGDAAVGANRPVNDMAQIFNRVQGSGKLMTQELNMIEQGMPGFAQAMADSLGVTQEEFRNMVTAGEVSSAEFLDVMEDFAGGMASAYAESWDGMVANTKAYIGILGENLLRGVFQDSKKSLEDFIELLSSDEAVEWAEKTGIAIGDAFRDIKDTVSDTVEWYQDLEDWQQKLIVSAGLFAVGIGPVLSVLGRFGGAVATIGKGLGGLMTALGAKRGVTKAMKLFSGSTVAATGVIGTGKSGLIGKMGTLAGSAVTTAGAGGVGKLTSVLAGFGGPVGIASGAITVTLLGAFAKLYSESEGVRWAVQETGNIIVESFEFAADKTVESFENIINNAFDPFNQKLHDTEEPMLKFSESIELMGTFSENYLSSLFESIGLGFDDFYNEFVAAGETVEVFGETVSEETAAMMEDYNTFSEEATQALADLRYSQDEITEEQLISLSEAYQAMNDEALLKLDERHVNEVEQMNEMFAETFSLTDQNKQDILERVDVHYNTEYDRLDQRNERIQQIIDEANQSEEGLTNEHIAQIEKLQSDHHYQTAENLSQSEVEQQAIIERMSSNQMAVSEQTVSELVKDSVEAKNKSIKEAEEKRDGIINWATDQYENHGTITADERDAIIDDAEMQYKSAVGAAENRHDEVLDWARAQSEEHGIIVDGETGDILTKWDIFKDNFGVFMESFGKAAWEGAKSAGRKFANGMIDGVNWLRTQFNKIPEKLGISFRLPLLNQAAGGVARGGVMSAFSNGTDYHLGGAALVGDKGPGNGIAGQPSNTREIVELPNGKEYLVDGDVIFPDFPKGAKVKSNQKTEKELEKRGLGNYATGSGSSMITGVKNKIEDFVIDRSVKATAQGIKFKNMLDDIYDYATEPNKLIDQLLSEVTFEGPEVVTEIGPGLVKSLGSGMIDKVKGFFEESTSTGDGSHILGKPITAGFGKYPPGINFNGGIHYGLDTHHVFDPLLSPINGVVTRVWNDYGGGRSIEIKAGRDFWWFMHLLAPNVKAGDSVSAGQRIGTTGNSGHWTTGPHLHTQYMPGSPGNHTAKDPLPVLRSLKNKGAYENGGIISSHGYYEGAEGNKPEMVIPLTNRSRAVELMFEALSYMGDDKKEQTPQRGGSDGKVIQLLTEQNATLNRQVDLLIKLLQKDFDISLDGEVISNNKDERDAIKAAIQF